MALTRILEDNITPGSITANSLNAVAVSVSSGEYANAAYNLANTVNANATSAGVYANAAFAAANTSGGGVSNASVYIYDTTVTSNIVLLEGQNGLSVGPITIANNVSINIASNSRWVVI